MDSFNTPPTNTMRMNRYEPSIPDDWQARADELERTTVLHPRQAEVRALAEAGVHRELIADELDISPNTVDEHKQAIRRQARLAANTVDELAALLPAGAGGDDVDA